MKISIIMPVYNTKADYLSCAISSVLNQSYTDFELIIVDDGSHSECANQCNMLGMQDSRIMVIHQENSGVSTARNRGTELAQGDYVMYMDSDDLLAPYALQQGVKAINTTHAQFVFSGIQHIKSYSAFYSRSDGAELDYRVFGKNEIEYLMESFLTQRNALFTNINGVGIVNRGPCSRLVETSIAKAVKFEKDLVIGEDVVWNISVLKLCASVCFVNNIWYGYLVYGTSSLRKYYGNRVDLLEKYHTVLYSKNQEFCNKYPAAYATNMVVSFYSMVIYEYLSDQCTLSAQEKRSLLKDFLNREPWLIMKEWKVFRRLPMRYQLFLLSCELGIGVELLKVWGAVKKWIRRVRQ